MDNYFQKCPAMMEDGKIYTDYSDSVVRDSKIKQDNKLIDHNEYREFLQTNAKFLIDSTWSAMKKTECHENGCVFTGSNTYINPGYFFTQRTDYDNMMKNRDGFPCAQKDDYRLGTNN